MEVRYRDKATALQAVERDGRDLRFASKELRGDKEVVLQAVRASGSALGYASGILQADKDVVLEAVRKNGFALEFATGALRADKDVVLEAVRQHGLALRAASDDLQADKDMVLLAARHEDPASFAHMAMDHWMPEAGIDERIFDSVVNCSIAVEGEECPIATVFLASVPAECDSDGNIRVPEHFRCSCTLMSGFSFECDVEDQDSNVNAPRFGSSLDDLARTIVDRLPGHMLNPTERVFIVFDTKTRSVTPWDWNRPLSDFLPRLAQEEGTDD